MYGFVTGDIRACRYYRLTRPAPAEHDFFAYIVRALPSNFNSYVPHVHQNRTVIEVY